jgi:FkbM family methyltransferase
MKRHILIDLGCNHGLYTKAYLKDHKEAVAYGFEPNPNLKLAMDKISRKFNNRFLHVPKAAWTNNGIMKFYLAEISDRGSTLVLGKRTSSYKHPVDVVTVDFSHWLADTVSPEDFVHLKVDIEGAEYDVLEKIITDGTIDLVDEMHVEFHLLKIDNKYINAQRHCSLVSALQERVKIIGSNLERYAGLCNNYCI